MREIESWTRFAPQPDWVVPAPLTRDLSMWHANNRYAVCCTAYPGGWLWLSIAPLDGSPVRRWRDLQRIKNELAGPEREAVEVFPAESRLHDACNAYDLWVGPEGFRFPVGWRERDVLTSVQAARLGLRQEPLDTERPVWPKEKSRRFRDGLQRLRSRASTVWTSGTSASRRRMRSGRSRC